MQLIFCETQTSETMRSVKCIIYEYFLYGIMHEFRKATCKNGITLVFIVT